MNQGKAKTDKFLLGTATIMLGEMGTLTELDESKSIGLVKDVTLEFSPTYIDLQQGVTNQTVFSVRNGQDTRITGSSYEFTDTNMAYAAGLNGDKVTLVEGVPYTVKSAAAGDGSDTVELTVDTPSSPVTIVQDDHVVIHSAGFSTIAKVVDAATISTGTLVVEGNFHAKVTAGAKVTKVNVMDLGSNSRVQYLCAKIVGELPNGDVVVIEIPKVQWTSGLSMAFTTGDFSNMALELKPTALLTTDPDYAKYGNALVRVAMAGGVGENTAA
ncbi:hypothetical protein [Photobacterium sp. GSS17]|uniref:hypothetical protein n=1 Tax=Photobacterium sp. GSS17 TaxID=3020715 RepID=UPI00235F52C9|nr:hypothetical protein [Photobacterium sp. GSS17]